MGKAEGHGKGRGEGQGHVENGGTSGEHVAAGCGLAVCCTVLFCIVGIPMLIAGIVLYLFHFTFGIGVSLIAVSCGFTIIGVILIILLCTGVIGKKKTHSETSVVFMTHPSNQGYATPYNPQMAPPYDSIQHQQNMAYPPPQNGPVQSTYPPPSGQTVDYSKFCTSNTTNEPTPVD